MLWFCWQIAGYMNCPGRNFGAPRPSPACVGGPKRCHFTSNWLATNGRHFGAQRRLGRPKHCAHWENAMRREKKLRFSSMTRSGQRERNCERPNCTLKQAMLPVRVVFLKRYNTQRSRNEESAECCGDAWN